MANWQLRAAQALLLAAGLLAASAGAQPPAGPAPAAHAEPALVALGRHAEEVAVRLRQMSASLEDEPALQALEADAAVDEHGIADLWARTGSLLEGKPRRLALDALANSWSSLRAGLEDTSRPIDARVRRREIDLAALHKLHDSWTGALDLAQKADAPASVVERAQATLEAIDAMLLRIEARRARVLVLQDGASRAAEACDEAIARVGDARREAVERIFVEREPPVWRFGSAAPTQPPGADAAQTADEVSAAIESVRLYARQYRASIAASLAIFVGLLLLLRRERAGIEGWAARDPHFASAASALRTPLAAALLLAVVLTRPLRPNPPAAVQQLAFAFAMLAAVFMLRPQLGARVLPAVYGLTVLFLFDVATQLLTLAPGVEQLFEIAEKGATAALLLWAAARFGEGSELASRSQRWRSGGPVVLRLLALGCVASAAAAALGYVELADFVGGGALFLVYSAFAVIAFRVAAESLLAIALVRGPLAGGLRAVARHRTTVERRLARALDLSAIVFWIWLALFRFELIEPAQAIFAGAFGARLRLGALDLAVGKVLGFTVVIVGAWLLSRVVVALLEDDVFSRMALPRGVPYALSSLTRYALLVAGFLLALTTLGLDLTHITVLVSAFGVGLGFGLQQVVANFVSGLLLLFERPVQVGDAVQLGELVGEVVRIGLRASTLRTSEGAEVIVPNSRLIDQQITNWTLSDRKRRVDLELSVAAPDGFEAIQRLLIEVARRDPRVSAEHEPEALVVRFSADSAEFQLRFWTEDPQWMRLRSDLGVAVQQALRAAARPAEAGSLAGSGRGPQP